MARQRTLEGLRVSVTKNSKAALKEAAEEVREQIVENASLADHSLDDLARLGHPYSVERGGTLHTPSFLVHRQSGQLRRNVEKKQVNQFTFDIGVDPNRVPYILAVVLGTRFLVARDFIRAGLLQAGKKVEKIFNKAVKKSVNG